MVEISQYCNKCGEFLGGCFRAYDSHVYCEKCYKEEQLLPKNLTTSSIIKVDMDGVLAELMPAWIYKYNLIMQTNFSEEDITDWDFAGIDFNSKIFKQILYCEDLFEHLDPVENAIDSLYRLNEKYKVVIVSNANGSIPIITGKLRWIKKNLPFINRKTQVVFTSNKNLVHADVIIDDGPYLLESDDSYKILFSKPFNTSWDDSKFIRVSGWEETLKFLGV